MEPNSAKIHLYVKKGTRCGGTRSIFMLSSYIKKWIKSAVLPVFRELQLNNVPAVKCVRR